MANIPALLQSKWTAAIAGSAIFSILVAIMTARQIPKVKPAEAEASESGHGAGEGTNHVAKAKKTKQPSWLFQNAELDEIVKELKRQKAAVTEKEGQLADWEARLKSERAELDQVLKNVKTLQEDFDKRILTVKEEEKTNLKRLARTYAAMEPLSAATIMRELDDAVIVKILLFMEETQSAPILETFAKQTEVEAKRAASISEALRLSMGTKKAQKS